MRDGGSRPAPFMSVATGGFGFVRSGPVRFGPVSGRGRSCMLAGASSLRAVLSSFRFAFGFGLGFRDGDGRAGLPLCLRCGRFLIPWRGWMVSDRPASGGENRPARTDVSENGPERRMPIQTLRSPAAWAGSGTLRGAFRSTCGSSRSQPIRSCRRRCPDGSAPR